MQGTSRKAVFLPLVIVAALIVLTLWRIKQQTVEVDSGRFMIMGTFARIRVRCQDRRIGQRALNRARAALENVDRLMSTYREDSELSTVNRNAANKPVPVSDETYALLRKSIEYSRITDGAFDITVMPLLKVWKQAAKEDRLPSEAELADARQRVGWRKLILSDAEGLTVRFGADGMELTVDAIAKGYAVDRALEALQIDGVDAALVDIGGEIACFGRDWIIGIQDPFAAESDNPFSETVRWKIRLREGSAATSGNYRRYVTIGGKKYSHIIDPRSGRPAEKLPSVTIVAPKCVDADALATAVSVMGPQAGMKLIESLPDTEAFLIAGTKEDMKIRRSSGFEKYRLDGGGSRTAVTR